MYTIAEKNNKSITNTYSESAGVKLEPVSVAVSAEDLTVNEFIVGGS